jgi:xanthosine utilization system XapX-like protein
MVNLIIAVVLGLIVLVLLAIFINKIPKKLHPIIIVVLLGISVFFGYKLYKSIEEPVKFEASKEERYKEVVAQLILLRELKNVIVRLSMKSATSNLDFVLMILTDTKKR